MFALRQASKRRYKRLRGQEAWQTFDSRESADPLTNRFSTLAVLKEGRLQPSAGVKRPRFDAEIVTYVREGTLTYQDSTGRTGLIRGGEFQRATVARGSSYSVANASTADGAHVFQICLRSDTIGSEPDHERKRFSAAERRGKLCLVASPDAREASLLLHHDTYLYSAIFDPGQHVVHQLSGGRGAWLHIVDGEVLCSETTLKTGDGAGITNEASVSFTAIKLTEVLLLDIGAFEVSDFTPAEQL